MINRAFSLVELAMVMAIMAVLLAGVTGGARLMESSRLNKIALDLTEIESSIKAFELAYKALPGDLSNAQSYFGSTLCQDHGSHSVLTCNGDGNNELGSYYTSEGKRGEHAYAYLHMQLAGVYKGRYAPHSSTADDYWTISDLNTPSTYTKAGLKAYYAFWGNNVYGDSRYMIMLGKARDTDDGNHNKPYDAAFSLNMVKKLDYKIDDNDVTTGRMRSTNSTDQGTCNGTDEIKCRILFYEQAI